MPNRDPAPPAGRPRPAGEPSEAGDSGRRPATEAEARALASAIRLRILRLCLDRPLTNKEIAEHLGVPPATALHHVRTLVATGFLVAQPERRGTRRAREVPYLATRKSWRVDVGEAYAADSGAAMVDAFLEEIRLVGLDRAGLYRLGLRLTEQELATLRERLHDLFTEYAQQPPSPDGKPYSLFTALFEDVSRE